MHSNTIGVCKLIIKGKGFFEFPSFSFDRLYINTHKTNKKKPNLQCVQGSSPDSPVTAMSSLHNKDTMTSLSVIGESSQVSLW